MNLLVDSRWIGDHGIGRFAKEVIARLPDHDHIPNTFRPLHPLDPFWLRRRVSRLRPDLYFTPAFNPPWRSPVPFVFCIHDLVHLRFANESSVAKRAFYDLHVRPAARRARAIATVSEYSRQEIVEWAGVEPKRVVNVGNGVSGAFTSEGSRWEPGYRYFLYVGNRKPHKNVDALFEAFARARFADDVVLALTGTADRDTEQRVARLGVGGRVRFLGDLSDSELANRYRGALALVMPSLYEGFGLPLVEAMACGTPIVASDRTSIPEVVGDAALLVDATDRDEFASALEEIVRNEELRHRLISTGEIRVKTFSWDGTGGAVRELLEAQVAGRPR